MTIVQCEGCGRVHVDGEWQHRPEIQPTRVGICATCLAWKQKQAKARYYREARGVERRAAKGYGGPAEGEDVFRNFRE